MSVILDVDVSVPDVYFKTIQAPALVEMSYMAPTGGVAISRKRIDFNIIKGNYIAFLEIACSTHSHHGSFF